MTAMSVTGCKSPKILSEPEPGPTPTSTPDISFEFVTKWGSSGGGNGQFAGGLLGISIDNSTGRVYVADPQNDRVQVFESDGTFVTKIGMQGVNDGEFDEPRAVLAVSHTAKIYVADKNNFRIQVFDTAGTFLGKWGTYGNGDGEFTNTTGICEDSATGNIYVADAQNSIQVFTSAGVFIKKISGAGSPDGVISGTAGISIDAESRRIYVAEVSAHRVRVFDLDGNQVNKWGTDGSNDGQFAGIHDVLYDPVMKRVYTTDVSNTPYDTHVQVFSPEGIFMAKFSGEESGGDDFSCTAGIAINRSTGNLFVGGFLQQFLQVFKVIN